MVAILLLRFFFSEGDEGDGAGGFDAAAFFNLTGEGILLGLIYLSLGLLYLSVWKPLQLFCFLQFFTFVEAASAFISGGAGGKTLPLLGFGPGLSGLPMATPVFFSGLLAQTCLLLVVPLLLPSLMGGVCSSICRGDCPVRSAIFMRPFIWALSVVASKLKLALGGLTLSAQKEGSALVPSILYGVGNRRRGTGKMTNRICVRNDVILCFFRVLNVIWVYYA